MFDDILQNINVARMLVKYMIKKYKKNVISDDAYIYAIIDYYQDEIFNEIPYFTSLGYLLNKTHYDYYAWKPSVYEFYKSQVNKILL